MPAATHRPAGPGASGVTGNPPEANQTAAARHVRALNDTLRRNFVGGRIVITAGVQALDEADRAELLRRVQAYQEFDTDNDPFGEHDFGRVDVGGASYYWKIDYYDADLVHGSPDPADETLTRRVITVMRDDEY
ncbi:DUF3768 domain-containing protein [Rhizobium wenxiniae]|uniref:DUF3768 domain-containing protein n=1 Tax=Rhizobium wenxiniae TaxID=1737357 RepID=UPI001C6EA9B9|nr:DUF3768 domain-containing protein [Rhizobium wenxiniae]MBW9090041.1 DUF3768 domain-containing protein [Rhizobium wenxiniae]